MKTSPVTINGVPWTFWHDDQDGWCDHHTRALWVQERLKDKHLLGTLIHEVMHAQHPDLDEGRIEMLGAEMTEIVWKFCHGKGDKGFRVPKHEG